MVNVLAKVRVPDRAGIFKFRVLMKCRIDVAVSPDNISDCDGQKLDIGMIWQHFYLTQSHS